MTPVQLMQEVNRLHEQVEQDEQSAARGAWEAGKRLNLAREMLRNTEWGAWGRFYRMHCPNISAMTIWRYRTIAAFFNTELEFDGMTLSEMYVKIKIAKFKKEGDYGGNNVGEQESESYTENLFKKLAKLSKKFDEADRLNANDKELVLKASRKLVQVMEGLQQPSVVEVEANAV